MILRIYLFSSKEIILSPQLMCLKVLHVQRSIPALGFFFSFASKLPTVSPKLPFGVHWKAFFKLFIKYPLQHILPEVPHVHLSDSYLRLFDPLTSFFIDGNVVAGSILALNSTLCCELLCI